MRTTIKILVFVALCLLAAAAADRCATAQYTGYKCKSWGCTGNVGGCTLTAGYFVYFCTAQSGATCNLSGWWGVCPGLDMWDLPCDREYYDCNNP